MLFDSAAVILSSVALSAGSQIMLKRGMMTLDIQAAIKAGATVDIAIAITSSSTILAGLFCYGLSFLLWLYVLSRVPLSTAYPFIALGIVLTVLAAFVIFAEPISLAKSIGVFLIMGGVILVGVAG